MKIVTWNVNGIRSLKKNVSCVLNELSTNVACFQETKVSRGQIPETLALVEGYSSYFSYPRKQSGYSGVATYCRDEFVPEDAEEGLSTLLSSQDHLHEILGTHLFLEKYDLNFVDFDSEGRVIITYHLIKCNTEIRRLAIINVYCPRVDPEKPERHLYKIQFCLLLEAKLKELCKTGCSVIIVGDLNIARSVIDHCDPGDEKEFNSSEARLWFNSFLSSKVLSCDDQITVVDAFRHFYPDKKDCYTCWNVKTGARQTNYGTRIDYILVSSDLIPLLESCEILSDYHGSDHCPVELVLKCDPIVRETVHLPALCTRLWPEFTGQQKKLQAFFRKTQDLADTLTSNREVTSSSTKKAVAKTNKQKSITSFFKCPNTSSNISSSIIKEDLIDEQNGSYPSSSPDDVSAMSGDKNSVDSQTASLKNTSTASTAWKTMLSGPPKPPLCSGHKKESVLRTVKKKGPNCGRSFFMCAQPAGHSSNPDANCNFFQWVNAPKVNKLRKT